MMDNRSAPRGLVFPTLVYADVAAAITWLCDACAWRTWTRTTPAQPPAARAS